MRATKKVVWEVVFRQARKHVQLPEPTNPLAKQMSEEDAELQRALALSMQSAPRSAPTDFAQSDEERQIAEAIALSLQQSAPPSGQPVAPPMDMDATAAVMTDDDELNAALALSMQSQEQLEPVVPTVPDVSSLQQLLFGEAAPLVEKQWLHQGIWFTPPPAADADPVVGSRPFSAGLAQEQGGPCAVLAAAQAYQLRRLLFEAQPSEPAQKSAEEGWLAGPTDGSICLQPDEPTAVDALLRGLADILWSAATTRGIGPPNESSTATVALLPASALPFEGSAPQLIAALLEHAVAATSWVAVYSTLKERLEALRSSVGARRVAAGATPPRRSVAAGAA